MADVASLRIAVESSGVDRAKKSLDGLASSAANVENKTTNLSGRARDARGRFIKLGDGINATAGGLNNFGKAANGSSIGIANMMNSFRGGAGLGNVADGLMGIASGASLMPVALAAAGAAFVAFAVKTSADMEMLTVNFSTMMGSMDDAVEHMNTIKTMAAKTPFGISGLAQTSQLLMQFGIEAEDSIAIMQRLGDVSGGNQERLLSLAGAYGKITSMGKLEGESLERLINAGFNPLIEIMKKTGESMSQVRTRMSKGAVSAQEIAEAFKSATSEGGKFYKGMENSSKTLMGLWSTLKDEFSQLAMTLGDALLPILKYLAYIVQNNISILTSFFNIISKVLIQPLMSGFAAIQKIFYDTFAGNAMSTAKKAIEFLATQFDKFYRAIGKELLQAFTDIKTAIGELFESLSSLFPSIDEFDIKAKALNMVMRQLAFSIAFISLGISTLVVGIQVMVDAIKILVQNMKASVSIISAGWEAITNPNKRNLVAFKEAFKNNAQEISAIGKDMQSKISTYSDKASKNLTTMKNALLDRLPAEPATAKTKKKETPLLTPESAAGGAKEQSVPKGFMTWDEFLNNKLSKSLENVRGLSESVKTIFADLGTTLTNLAISETVNGFESIGKALADGAVSAKEMKDILAQMSMQILKQLPMLFIQAGLSAIAANPTANLGIGLGLIAAGLSSAVISGFAQGKQEEQNNAKGGIYSDMKKYAKGGMFSNSIVNTPTKFASGGTLGQMGEGNKPEAIIPLTRTSDGSLGVRSTGGGGVTMTVNNYSNAQVQTEERQTSSGTEMIMTIKNIVNGMVNGGDLDKSLQGRYAGMQRRGI